MSRAVPAPEQIAATDPSASNWVGANAGSGKTHVLTQRVARLLLDGAEPHSILCLTYTKAAAAEMQSRLFRTLGGWAMAPGCELATTLAGLSGAAAPVTDPARLADARRLFAKALETPGGLKIQTIHAFCSTMLRRFPLEAGVSPRFDVADERRSRALVAEVREAMAVAAADAFDRAARTLNEGDIDALAAAVLRRAPDFACDLEDCLAAHFGPAARLSPEEAAAAALNELDRPRLTSLAAALLGHGGQTEQQLAAAFDVWLSGQCADAAVACGGMLGILLKQDGDPRRSGLATKALLLMRPDAVEEIQRLQGWASRARESIIAARMVRRVRDLHAFAAPLLTRHSAAKEALALLDFDDLVRHSRTLLTDGVMRAWALYKLDQGIDHVLIDEAQDTAPAQWDVIAAIAEEFFSGSGARRDGRSVFVVGDEKQSIYSFQGAEPHAFGRMREHFRRRLADAGRQLGCPDLVTSYRSAPAILQFVDAVFAGDAASGLTVGGEAVRHVAHRQGEYGCVELWPVIEPDERAEEPEWWRPVDAVPASHPKERLATAVAGHVSGLLRDGWLAPTAKRPTARRIAPRDILVLVAKRDRLASGIIGRLKALGVPVAGADRLVLTRELAVMDLLALAKVCCLPSDELSLAALLRSPLCGLDEETLFALAHPREGGLWRAVQESPHRAVAEFLADMAAHSDFLRPYEFLERALVRHDGRRRLLARLGPETEDAIDELLAQALAYETSEAPTLTGFVTWIEADEITVRREMESGDFVRVMTVHGAKGLEAPVVILPDTISGGAPRGGPLLLAGADGNRPGLVLWAGRKGEDDRVCAEARAESERQEKAERRRLLYVALTRAKDRLILCGAGTRKTGAGDAPIRGPWYEMLQAGMEACPGVTRHPSPTGEGEMLRFATGTAPVPEADAAPAAIAAPGALPAWLCPAPREVRRARIGPSSLAPGSAHGGAGIGRPLALRIGEAVHLLLERLPDLPATRREKAAERLLAGFPDLSAEHLAAVRDEAERVLAMPEAAALFAPGALGEAAATMPGAAGATMIGRIDRLVVGPERVLIVDFKTDRAPPADPDGVPEGYLAQLGAYDRAIAAAFPGREIRAALLWTATPALMPLDQESVRLAYQASVARRDPLIDSVGGRP